jgi:hypothetical protein
MNFDIRLTFENFQMLEVQMMSENLYPSNVLNYIILSYLNIRHLRICSPGLSRSRTIFSDLPLTVAYNLGRGNHMTLRTKCCREYTALRKRKKATEVCRKLFNEDLCERCIQHFSKKLQGKRPLGKPKRL